MKKIGNIIFISLMSILLVFAIGCNGNGQYSLTINTRGQGATTGSGNYDKGQTAQITATASSGWQFVTWTGGPVNDYTAKVTTIDMNSNYTITANFEAT
jgi:hypothetical protein